MKVADRTRPSLSWLTGILLYGILSLQPALSALSGDITYRYVDIASVPSSISADTVGCGKTKDQLCLTISYAVSDARNLTAANTPVTILLTGSLDGMFILRNQSLESVENVEVRVDSQLSAVQMSLQLRMNEKFLTIRNCSNITIQSLDINMNNSLGTAVSIELSHHVQVRRCQFTGIGINTHGLTVQNCTSVLLHTLAFSGKTPLPPSPDVDVSYLSAALLISFHDTAVDHYPSKYSEGVWNALNGSDIAIVKCSLSLCGLQPRMGIYRRVFPSAEQVGQSVALHVHFHGSARKRNLLIQDCYILYNTSPYDPTMAVVFQDGSQHNTITMLGCTFSRNAGYLGGAMFIRYSSEGDNGVIIRPSATNACLFYGNQALLEASVARVAFGGPRRDYPGSADVASDLFSMTDCSIVNSATGFILTTLPGTIVATTLDETDSTLHGDIEFQVQLTNCTFSGNNAQAGSGIYAQLTAVSLKNCTFRSNTGAPILALESYLLLEGVTRFERNVGGRGGAVQLADDSILELGQGAVVYFVDNNASVQGGAIHADVPTSSQSMVEALEFQLDIGLSQKRCFFQLPLDTRVYYTNPQTPPTGSAVILSGNRAPVGQNFYASSLIPCAGAPFLPQLANATTLQSGPASSKRSVVGSTFFTFFRSATCGCIKPFLNGTTIVYQRGCKRDQIANDVDQLGLVNEAALKFHMKFFHRLLNMYLENAYATPDISLFHVPWSAPLSFWWLPRLPPFSDSLNQTTALNESFILTEEQLQYSVLGNVTLYPAPGEEFSLTVDFADFQLAAVQVQVYVQVVTNAGSAALLRYGGLQYANIGYALFQSGHTLRGLSLAGAPGSTGYISLGAAGQIADNVLTTQIPFRIRPCHSGYQPSAMMLNPSQASAYVGNFSRSSPIPADGASDLDNVNALICRCSSSPGVEKCSGNGFGVTIKAGYWAGDLSGTSLVESAASPPYKVTQDFHGFELSELWLAGNFSSGFCWAQFCSYQNGMSDWSLRTTDPCLQGANRRGPLCSKCQEGHARVAFDFFVCHDACPNSTDAVFYIALLVGAILVVVLAVIFSIGAGPTFDSWLLHWQLGTFINPRATGAALNTIVPTFFCHPGQPSAPTQVAKQLIVPAYMFSIVLIIMRVSRMEFASRLVNKINVLPTLWGSMMWGYTYLMYTAFLLLSCLPFQGDYVYAYEATIPCFGEGHWPLATLALLILFLAVIPTPALLYRYRSQPRIKPLMDTYMNNLMDNRRWWISVNFLRRQIFIALAIFITLPQTRTAVVFMSIQALFWLHVLVMPFRMKIDNAFEAIILANAALIACLSAAEETIATRIALLFLVAWPTVAAVVISVFKDREKFKNVLLACRSLLVRHGLLRKKDSDRTSTAEVSKAATNGLDQPLLTVGEESPSSSPPHERSFMQSCQSSSM